MAQTLGSVACCLCGAATPADRLHAGMCLACTASQVDITEGIERELEVDMCNTCGHWYRNPQWVPLEPESAALLALCVKRVRGLKKLRLVDASWIWTEPHSRRLKVKLTVASEVISGSVLQQSLVLEYHVKTRNCDACNKKAAKGGQGQWQAKVQLRQRVEHPRTLLALEQALLCHGAVGRTVSAVKRVPDGLDFLFDKKQDAQRLVGLVGSLVPARAKPSQTVVAANLKQGTSNVKTTWAVDVAPLCRGDLALLPRATASSYGVGPLVLVARVGGSLHLVDPASARTAEITADAYWRRPFAALASRAALRTFVVIDCEVDRAAPTPQRKASKQRGPRNRGEAAAPASPPPAVLRLAPRPLGPPAYALLCFLAVFGLILCIHV
jgi:nonsense-mediated mRNA decay protein 3